MLEHVYSGSYLGLNAVNIGILQLHCVISSTPKALSNAFCPLFSFYERSPSNTDVCKRTVPHTKIQIIHHYSGLVHFHDSLMPFARLLI